MCRSDIQTLDMLITREVFKTVTAANTPRYHTQKR
jgi:hypothetical protein